MLAKLTSGNQLTLPNSVISRFRDTEYFVVSEESGRIVLTPVRATRVDAIRRKLAEAGLADADVAEAIAWARRRE